MVGGIDKYHYGRPRLELTSVGGNFKNANGSRLGAITSEEGTLQWVATETKYFLAALIPDCERAGEDVSVSGIAIDSRRVAAGDLFAALPGLVDAGGKAVLLAILVQVLHQEIGIAHDRGKDVVKFMRHTSH